MYRSSKFILNKKIDILNYRNTKFLFCVSQILLKYGGSKNIYITDKTVKEFWDPEDGIRPSFFYLKTISVDLIRSFIEKNIIYDDEIWNNDFIKGVFQGCVFSEKNSFNFKRVQWNSNPSLERIFKMCPFGGHLSKRVLFSSSVECLLTAPFLSLSHDENSLSFFSGVMASGVIVKRKKFHVVRYPYRLEKFFKEWGIPYEKKIRYLYISPIWPAILSICMPKSERKIWLNVSKPWNAYLYSAFLWRLYVKKKFGKNKIPYLLSYYKINTYFKKNFPNKKEMNLLPFLSEFGVNEGLYCLDKRIGECVLKWSSLSKE